MAKTPPKNPRAGRPPEVLAPDNLRMLAFVNHYRTHFDATAAARAVGYAQSFAQQAGYRLLRDGRVQELLAKHAIDAMAMTDIRVPDILRTLNEIMLLDPAETEGQSVDARTGIVTVYVKSLHQMPLHVRRAISSYRAVKRNLTTGDGKVDTVLEVKFYDKIAAARLLAEHKGALTPKADEVVSERRLETMTDEELAEHYRKGQEKWDRHLKARQKARLTLVGKKA